MPLFRLSDSFFWALLRKKRALAELVPLAEMQSLWVFLNLYWLDDRIENEKYPWLSKFQVLLVGQKGCMLNFSNRLALLTTFVHYSIHAIHHQWMHEYLCAVVLCILTSNSLKDYCSVVWTNTSELLWPFSKPTFNLINRNYSIPRQASVGKQRCEMYHQASELGTRLWAPIPIVTAKRMRSKLGALMGDRADPRNSTANLGLTLVSNSRIF